jgi:hypothetical protein
MPFSDVLAEDEAPEQAAQNPLRIVVRNDALEIVNEAEINSLAGAIEAINTITPECEEPVALIAIELKPGWRLVNGQPFYSAAWL